MGPPVVQVTTDRGQQDLDDVRRVLVLDLGRLAQSANLHNDVLEVGQTGRDLIHDVHALQRLFGQVLRRHAVHYRVLVVEVELGLEEGDGEGVGEGAQALADDWPVPVEFGDDPLAVDELDALGGEDPEAAEDFVGGELDLSDEDVGAVLAGAHVVEHGGEYGH